MRAWEQLFIDFLTRRGRSTEPYTDSDYFDYIDGKPRYDGVRAFLDLPRHRSCPRATRPTARRPRPSAGWATARTRSSPPCWPTRGCRPTRARSRCWTIWPSAAPRSRSSRPPATPRPSWRPPAWRDRFPVVVDGNVARRAGLAGKPAPDTFLDAAQQLGVPDRAVRRLRGRAVGRPGRPRGPVRAGRRGGPGGRRRPADRSGADVVVTDLGELVAMILRLVAGPRRCCRTTRWTGRGSRSTSGS